MPETIHITEVLAEIDFKLDANNERNTFSVGFSTNDGSYVFLNRAIATGLKMNMKDNAKRGFLAVDKNHKKVGHHYPVGIFSIIEFNGKRVYL